MIHDPYFIECGRCRKTLSKDSGTILAKLIRQPVYCSWRCCACFKIISGLNHPIVFCQAHKVYHLQGSCPLCNHETTPK